MKTLNVVLVDDAVEVRRRVKTLIEDLPGVEVIGEVGNAVNAIEIIEKLRPQVVILDIHMPGGSGIGVLRQIKLLDPSILVIMLTNFVASYYRSVSLKGGADFFFDKALELQDVKHILSELSGPCCIGNGTLGYTIGVGPTIR